jgi:hypothetical protein
MRLSIVAVAMMLSACAATGVSEYQVYTDTQRALNKDHTMAELARISALTEIVRDSTDSAVRIQAIRALQEIQRGKRPLVVELPKHNIWRQ